jgi:HPt (histidine-containing phosphotransfer) domain-containing protein
MSRADLENAQPDLGAALNRLWERFLPEMSRRAAILEAAASALAQGSLSPAQKQEAASAAHKLAGILGTFNLERGTELARRLETLFLNTESPDPSVALQLAEQVRSIVESRK